MIPVFNCRGSQDQGRKDDQGKIRWDLVPPAALEEVVKVYTVGAVKYGDRNWEQGILFSRLFAATQRHIWSWWRGEACDQESGLHHLAHAAWNCLALIAYEQRSMVARFDDRPGRQNKERKQK